MILTTEKLNTLYDDQYLLFNCNLLATLKNEDVYLDRWIEEYCIERSIFSYEGFLTELVEIYSIALPEDKVEEDFELELLKIFVLFMIEEEAGKASETEIERIETYVDPFADYEAVFIDPKDLARNVKYRGSAN